MELSQDIDGTCSDSQTLCAQNAVILNGFPRLSCDVSMARDSSVSVVIPTGWTVRGSKPVGARFSAPIQIGPGAHLASCTTVTGSLPGVKRPGRDVDHTPPSVPEVKERVAVYKFAAPRA